MLAFDLSTESIMMSFPVGGEPSVVVVVEVTGRIGKGAGLLEGLVDALGSQTKSVSSNNSTF